MTDRIPELILALILVLIVGACSPSADNASRETAGTLPALGDGLETATPASAGLQEAPLDALTQEAIDASFPDTTSVLLLQDGKLVFERYFRDGGPAVLNDTRSAMKSVTALAVLAAVADGKLASLDEPVFPKLADLAPFAHDGPLKQQITLADFLTMSSALDCNDWEETSPGNEEYMYPLDNWSRWAVDIPLKQDYQRDAAGRGPFSYCTAGVFLLGQVLQRVTGEPVDQYMGRRLLDPLGIGVREWPRSPTGEVMTGGGLRLTSRDLARLGLLVASGGRWQGVSLLPAESVAAALTVRRSVDAEQGYGYLFWQRAYRSPCGPLEGWYMSGNGGNVVAVVPERDLVAVVTRRHYGRQGMHQQTLALIQDHLLAALSCTGAPG